MLLSYFCFSNNKNHSFPTKFYHIQIQNKDFAISYSTGSTGNDTVFTIQNQDLSLDCFERPMHDDFNTTPINTEQKTTSDTMINLNYNILDRNDLSSNQNVNETIQSNIILDANIPFSSQVTIPYRTYVITEDFDLSNDCTTIEIPEGCVLKFLGGSLNNGQIHFGENVLTHNYNGTTTLTGIATELYKIVISSNGIDDTQNINNLINHFENSKIQFIDSIYYINGNHDSILHCGITISNNNDYIFNNTIFRQINTSNAQSKIIKIGGENIKLSNLIIEGDILEHQGGGEWNYGVQIAKGCSNVTLSHLEIRGFTGDCINMFDFDGSANNIVVKDCIFSSSKRGCISLESIHNVVIEDCRFIKDNTIEMPPNFFIDIEPLSSYRNYNNGVYDVTIKNCSFINSEQISIGILLQATYENSVHDISIINNKFSGNPPVNGFLNFPSKYLTSIICHNNIIEVTSTDYGYDKDLGELIGVSLGADIVFNNISITGKNIPKSHEPIGIRLYSSNSTKTVTRATFNNCMFNDCRLVIFGNLDKNLRPEIHLNNCIINYSLNQSPICIINEGLINIDDTQINSKNKTVDTQNGEYHIRNSTTQ